MSYRIERDTLGEMNVPDDALYGAQTARALLNFPISGLKPHPDFVWATVVIKRAAAIVNRDLGELDARIADAIVYAADEVLAGRHAEQFVVDVYQAGAGTSHNMNVNEVLANRAVEILSGTRGDHNLVHPNDHVNRGQSTNDVIPTAIRLGSLRQAKELDGALLGLQQAFRDKAVEFHDVLKSGRTHLQDAVPMRLGSEFGAWSTAIEHCGERIEQALIPLGELGIGGNAIGSGVNTPAGFHNAMVAEVSRQTGLSVRTSPDLYERTQSMADFVQLSATLRTLALELIRICNDIRLLASGPHTGLGEIVLPPVQPGSSIMPGKANPVMAEMLTMVCYQVCGADIAIAMAAQAGQLDLNVMMPLIAHNLSTSFTLLTNAIDSYTTRCVICDWHETLESGEIVAHHGIVADKARCSDYLERSAGLATLLNPAIGYDAAAEVVKQAKRERRTIRQIVLECGLMTNEEFDALIQKAVR